MLWSFGKADRRRKKLRQLCDQAQKMGLRIAQLGAKSRTDRFKRTNNQQEELLITILGFKQNYLHVFNDEIEKLKVGERVLARWAHKLQQMGSRRLQNSFETTTQLTRRTSDVRL